MQQVMVRTLLLVATATAVAATSLQAEENAKAWLQAYDEDPDSLGGLQSSNPDAYNIVKSLLDKRDKGKLDYEHPISDISYSDESTLLAAPVSKSQSESSHSFSESDYEKEAPSALRSSNKASDDAGTNWKAPLEDEDSAVEKALGAVEAVTGRSVPRKHAVEEVADDAPQSSESWADISNAMTGLSLHHAQHKEEQQDARSDDQKVKTKRPNRYLRVQSPVDSERNSRKSALAADEASLDEDLKTADQTQAPAEPVQESPKKNPYMETLGSSHFQETGDADAAENHGWRSWSVEKGNPYLKGFDLKIHTSAHQETQPESESAPESVEAHHQTAFVGIKSEVREDGGGDEEADSRESRWGHWRLTPGTYEEASPIVAAEQETNKEEAATDSTEDEEEEPDYKKIEGWLNVGQQQVSLLRIQPIEAADAPHRKKHHKHHKHPKAWEP